ncbi:MAG: VIT domain-containing protein, partial [Thermoguttaceae bacterium]
MKTFHESLVLLMLFFLLSPSLVAQTLPPALVAQQDGRAVRLELTKLDIEVRIVGAVAETASTMTFTNPLLQNLEGDFCLPLPEGATISGYSLDIAGTMVDGVAVERQRGREVFEQIARRRIDPGLAEWLVGNSFKTRIFPVPAKGSRTIRVQYLSELLGGRHEPVYHLPLNYQQSVKEFALRIEVVRPSTPPEVTQGPLKDCKFMKAQDNYIAEGRAADVLLNHDLVLALPKFKESHVLVEKAGSGPAYFAIQDFPEIPALQRTPAPKHIVILWDASRSRAGADHDREIGMLRAYFESLRRGPVQPIAVDLVTFANTLGEPKRLVLSDAEPSSLLKEIQAIQYDGGTRLGAIHPLGSSSPDLYLLFSDGISTFGKEEIPKLDAPVYAFSADPASNHALLHGLTMASGGRYFNLAHWKDAKVVPAIGQSPYCFLGATADDGESSNVFPQSPQPVDGRFILVGKLATAETKITLHYGAMGKVFRQRSFHIQTSQAEEGSVLKRLWAQKKLTDLMVLAEENEAKILELGKQFSMVTPYTSLIVLESPAQYREFGIPPPASATVTHSPFGERVGTLGQDKRRGRPSNLSDVIRMWDADVAEWSGDRGVSSNLKDNGKPNASPKNRTSSKSQPRNNTPRQGYPFAWTTGGMYGMG